MYIPRCKYRLLSTREEIARPHRKSSADCTTIVRQVLTIKRMNKFTDLRNWIICRSKNTN